MKKISLLLGMLFISSIYAVELSNNGEGDVIIFPFYTVENNHITTVNIDNNTDKVIAVKIKFMDRFFEREILDFNVYLAPYDEYPFNINTAISNWNNHEGESSAIFYREDSSCTPYLSNAYFPNGQEFLPFAMEYSDINYDVNMDRSQSGTLVIIDMGEVVDPEAQFIMQTNGIPNDCERIENNWRNDIWDEYYGGDSEYSMNSISGSLSATMSISNELSGASFNVNPMVLNNTFTHDIYHTPPGALDPNFHSDITDSIIKRNGTSEVYSWDYDAQALASLIQKTEISAHFDLTQVGSVDVSWVVSLLNKIPFVDITYGNPPAAILPFSNVRNVTDNGACDVFIVEVRDELGNLLNPLLNQDFKLCESVNVVAVRPFGQLPPLVLDDFSRSSINIGYLTQGTITLKTMPENQMQGYFEGNPNFASIFYGLPIEGFQLTKLDDGENNIQYFRQEFESNREIQADWEFIFINGFE